MMIVKCIMITNLISFDIDTAPCYPYIDKDPFIISRDNLPQLLFAGNQPGFASQLVNASDAYGAQQQVRLVCVPNFRETGMVVLCDLSQPSLPCYTISFK
jgi:DNA polymerase II small subunit/DNA polymerase delta subunit B